MAVTRNLARLSHARLAACATSVDELDAVCSFQALDPMDYLDLDWAPRLLQRVVEAAGAPAALAVALRRAMQGDGEVNADYRDQPDSVWEHPVSSLGVAAVADVSASLAELATLDVLSPWSVERAIEGLPPDAVPEGASAYLQGHFDALCAFYADGSTQRARRHHVARLSKPDRAAAVRGARDRAAAVRGARDRAAAVRGTRDRAAKIAGSPGVCRCCRWRTVFVSGRAQVASGPGTRTALPSSTGRTALFTTLALGDSRKATASAACGAGARGGRGGQPGLAAIGSAVAPVVDRRDGA